MNTHYGVTTMTSSVPGELPTFDKLEVLISRSCRLIFHFLCKILKETTPSRCGTQLGNVIRRHLDALVRKQ